MPQLVGGDVDTGHLPPQIRRYGEKAACPATEVEAPADAGTQQATQKCFRTSVVRCVDVEEGRVLVRQAVIPTHPPMISLGARLPSQVLPRSGHRLARGSPAGLLDSLDAAAATC